MVYVARSRSLCPAKFKLHTLPLSAFAYFGVANICIFIILCLLADGIIWDRIIIVPEFESHMLVASGPQNVVFRDMQYQKLSVSYRFQATQCRTVERMTPLWKINYWWHSFIQGTYSNNI
jgi:hypothetical protein